jgi:hypothetical protein
LIDKEVASVPEELQRKVYDFAMRPTATATLNWSAQIDTRKIFSSLLSLPK